MVTKSIKLPHYQNFVVFIKKIVRQNNIFKINLKIISHKIYVRIKNDTIRDQINRHIDIFIYWSNKKCFIIYISQSFGGNPELNRVLLAILYRLK